MTLLRTYLSIMVVVVSIMGQEKVELVVETGHSAAVRGMVVSPDGRTLASVGNDAAVRLWNIASRQELKPLRGHQDTVTGVVFSPTGSIIATSSEDKTVKLWNAATGGVLQTLTGYKDFVWSVAFSGDGRWLASITDKELVIWDLSNFDAPTARRIDGDYLSVAFAPNGDLLATGGYNDGSIKLWDASNGDPIGRLIRHKDAVRTLAFSPNGKWLVSGSDDGRIKIWDIKHQNCVRTLRGHTDWVNSVAWSSNSRTLASGGRDSRVKIWNTADGSGTAEPAGNVGVVRSVVFLANSSTLVFGGDATEICLFDTKTKREQEPLAVHSYYVNSIALSNTGKLLAVGSGDPLLPDRGVAVRLWDVERGHYISSLVGQSKYATALAFSTDEKILAVGSDDSTIILWDTASLTKLTSLASSAGSVTALAFSPNGILASAHSDESVRLWNTGGQLLVRIDLKGSFRIASLVFSPDARTLASKTWLGEVKFWDITTGAEMTYQQLPQWASFPDNRESKATVNGMTLTARRESSRVILFDNSGNELCTLMAMDENDWIVTTADGRFDTNKPLDRIRGLHWIINDDILNPLPLDVFLRQYYEPGILKRSIDCSFATDLDACGREFKPLPPISAINRVRPKLNAKAR